MNLKHLKILHLSTLDRGGAARAAYNLHKGFKSQQHDSKIIVRNKTIDDQDIIEYSPDFLTKTKQKISHRLSKKKLTNPNYCFYNYHESVSYTSVKKMLALVPFNPDLIIVHWVSNFINTKSMYHLNRLTKAPVFWYAMDMAPLTGGCHYAWDCSGYKEACGKCPALYSDKPKDISYKNLLLKQNYIAKTNLSLLVGSSFLKEQADHSTLFENKNRHLVFLGIDSNTFKPHRRNESRKYFGIPDDKKVILVGAASFHEERKGVKYLMDALTILSNKLSKEARDKIFLLFIGDVDPTKEIEINFEWRKTGLITNDSILAMTYQASDVFVCPSIEDSGPMMINESIMCGTPVVSFEAGVALDLVISGKTGYRAKIKNSSDLANGIDQILHSSLDDYTKIVNNCIELSLNELTPKAQVDKILKIYANLNK